VNSSADNEKVAEDLADALYTAVGFAVLGLQRLIYAGRQVEADAKARLNGASAETRAEVATIADRLDDRLRRLSVAPSPPLSEAASVALSAARHLREQFIDPWVESAPP